ncbi:centrosomal protein of 85 kDa-like isoform X3 [Denticeps clupeoides]|uniref:centrosomal protein of 85 kDa-like isoform X3 n=1 Tax=Denticeps clupeoides TaxID=299321 RepID=UPI0010A2C4C4|nr:centrosomal protein of 85 kDa-like isoform X3 [Denticeps clupeoides]
MTGGQKARSGALSVSGPAGRTRTATFPWTLVHCRGLGSWFLGSDWLLWKRKLGHRTQFWGKRNLPERSRVLPGPAGCSSTSSPGWVPGGDSAWQVGSSSRARRHSTASDSGDTGIGTSCSDSIEDRSSSSTTLSFQPLRGSSGIPTAHVMPSPSSSAQLGAPSPSPAGSPWSSCQLPSPLDTPLDMKDPRPVRRWSSLTRLTGQEKTSPTGRVSSYRADAHGSLDRGLLYGYRQDPHNHDLSSLGFRRLSSSVASTDTSSSRYRCDPADGKTDSSCSSPLKPATLDLAYSALPESKPPTPAHRAAPGGSPIQPAVRTQMWLSEQMEFRPGPDGCGLAAWQQDRLRQEAELTQQVLTNASLPVNTLVKLKEGLLRQRELEIDRQKQQILQLHSRIRENELRAKQVLQNQRGRCDEPFYLKPKDPHYEAPVPPTLLEHGAPLCGESAELGRRLAAAELEVVHLNEFLKQNTQKYTEDIKKLEEKMKTRDRYISSLKKKCQREQEQNLEKQQRVETLEKYLADLPSLDQLGGLQLQVGELQTRATDLGRSLEESRAELQDKEALIQKQQRREKELVATVQSLQAKVEQCLEDGVRLPMLDLKQLERTNTHLQEENTESSQLIDGQKKQIEKLRQDLMDVEKRLQQERTVCDELRVQLHQKRRPVEEAVVRGVPEAAPQEAGPLLKEAGPLLEEMSLCLLDLKGLCSILTQRAQGKEPNLALLLGIKSTGLPGEENERPPLEGGLRAKLLEVCQLRKDIDELRTIISDRYAQDMGDNCVTQ